MMKRLVLGLAGAVLLAIAMIPASAEQTFWTIDTGRLPSPMPTSSYPVNLEYYYLYNALPQSCFGHQHSRLCPSPHKVRAPRMRQPITAPYRFRPIARHT